MLAAASARLRAASLAAAHTRRAGSCTRITLTVVSPSCCTCSGLASVLLRSPARALSSDGRQSWKPGKRASAAVEDDDDDAEEAAARAAHAQREAAWKAEQAKQQQQQQQQHQGPAQDESEPSVLDELHIGVTAADASNPASKSSSSSVAASHSDSSFSATAADQTPAPPPSQQPTLKAQLRAFFLLTHPDLFEQHPREKKTNASSLALLSDFVDAIRNGGGGGDGHAAKSVRVEFWLRKKAGDEHMGVAAAEASSAAASAPPPASFYSVSSTLTLRRSGGGGRQQAQLHSALSSLFRQAGIKHATHWQWGDEFAAPSSEDGGSAGDVSDSHSPFSGSSTADGKPRSAGFVDTDWFDRFAGGVGGPAAESGGSPAAGGELESFLARWRGAAYHYSQQSRPRKHDFLLRMAHLRLQGIRVLFDCPDGSERSMEEQAAILKVFEKVMSRSKWFKAPDPIFSRASASSPSSSADPAPAPGMRYDSAQGGSGDPEVEQPTVPFSRSVRMPAAFGSEIFEQIKRAQMKDDMAAAAAAAAAANATGAAASGGAQSSTTDGAASDPSSPRTGSSSSATSPSSFESRRSPFSRVTHVFSSCLSSRGSRIDGRGRLVFDLLSPSSEWVRFLDASPLVIAGARATASHYRAIKGLERQVSGELGVNDLFAEDRLLEGGPVGSLQAFAGDALKHDASSSAAAEVPSTLGSSPSPAYQSFLLRLQRDAHQLHSLGPLRPLAARLSLRVYEPSSADLAEASSASAAGSPDPLALFDVDPTLGLLLVPLSASAADIRRAIVERGQECDQIRERHEEEVAHHTAALLHAKRHLHLRSLTALPSVSREQQTECAARLSRCFGALRDQLQHCDLRVGDEYACSEDDGAITIPWNWC